MSIIESISQNAKKNYLLLTATGTMALTSCDKLETGYWDNRDEGTSSADIQMIHNKGHRHVFQLNHDADLHGDIQATEVGVAIGNDPRHPLSGQFNNTEGDKIVLTTPHLGEHGSLHVSDLTNEGIDLTLHESIVKAMENMVKFVSKISNILNKLTAKHSCVARCGLQRMTTAKLQKSRSTGVMQGMIYTKFTSSKLLVLRMMI